VSDLSKEISRRTNKVAGKNKNTVSSLPIVLRVEYANCANLTMIDTPGFRLGGNESLRNEIARMNFRLMSPKNRIIVCLEQSTVEWANTTSRPIVQQIDRDFSRTILVNTKFDNRVKELRKASAANAYLSGRDQDDDASSSSASSAAAAANKRPFFISLPVQRDLDPEEFKTALRKCYLSDYKKLVACGFDEATFLPQVGFQRVKQFMEQLLTQKYYQSLKPTMLMLNNVVIQTEQELQQLRVELECNNLQGMRTRVLSFISHFNRLIERLLQGSIIGNPNEFGETLQEERFECQVSAWPDQCILSSHCDEIVENSTFKLYGGSQYSRLLHEFAVVAHSCEFPYTSIDEVASAIGTSKTHSFPSYEQAASDIVQIKAVKHLKPLIDMILQRTQYIFERMFHIAVRVLNQSDNTEYGAIGCYEHFIDQLKQRYRSFIVEISNQCKAKIMDDFKSLVEVADWHILYGLRENFGFSGNTNSNSSNIGNNNSTNIGNNSSNSSNIGNNSNSSNIHTSSPHYDYLNHSVQQTKERVLSILSSHQTLQEEIRNSSSQPFGMSRSMNQQTYLHVCSLAARLFAGIRFFFIKLLRSKLNAFFLNPMFKQLSDHMLEHFRNLDDSTFEQTFNNGVNEIKERITLLEAQLQQVSASRDEFKALSQRIFQEIQYSS